MLHISKSQIENELSYERLIPALKAAFCADIIAPQRQHYEVKNSTTQKDSTLLLMPAWEAGKYLGVKIVTVSPENAKYQLPSIQGTYILMDAEKGLPLAMLDAPTLTSIRTAAASALASSYLSREDSATLLMIGTGALAPRLIEAHGSVRPIKEVYIWGRNFEKAKRIASQFAGVHFSIKAISTIEEIIKVIDIISVATLSETPLVLGKWLQAGQHLDLVGAYKPTMREADDEAILKSRIFVDSHESAGKEAGDIVIPLQNGIITKEAIQADLFELCQANKVGRKTQNEITLFKSVGHALEDLAAAKLVYESIIGKD